MEAGQPVVATTIPENETVAIGNEVYKISDTVDAVSVESEGMSKQTKIIIGVGAGVLVLAVVAIIIFKKK